MTVYVDDMRASFGRMIMCHMIADTLDELHTMADIIGMKRSWFQEKGSIPHYDLSLSRKKLAIQNGAIQITQKQVVEIMKKQRGIKNDN